MPTVVQPIHLSVKESHDLRHRFGLEGDASIPTPTSVSAMDQIDWIPVTGTCIDSYANSLPTLLHIDVRSLDEILEYGTMPGVRVVPLTKLSARHLPPLPNQRPILFSCQRGGRSLKAATMAVSWGHSQVYTMDGGFEAWQQAQLPLTKPGLLNRLPSIHCFYESRTGTNQVVVVDDETLHTAVVDTVLDCEPMQITTRTADALLDYCKENTLKVSHILETHVHADHLTAAQYLKQQLPVQQEGLVPVIGTGERVRLVQEHFASRFALGNVLDMAQSGFDTLFPVADLNASFDSVQPCFQLGSLPVRVYAVPGHTPDSVAYHFGNNQAAIMIVGDSIFPPDVGSARCDFPGGASTDLYASIRSMYALPGNVVLIAGHDYPPSKPDANDDDEDETARAPRALTTVHEQRSTNKHVRDDTTEAAFVEWRNGRDKTLGMPRLIQYALQVNLRAGRLPGSDGMDQESYKKAQERGTAVFRVPYQWNPSRC